MNIDFSKGVDYWINIINRLLTAVANFLKDTFGIDLFPEDGETTEGSASE